MDVDLRENMSGGSREDNCFATKGWKVIDMPRSLSPAVIYPYYNEAKDKRRVIVEGTHGSLTL